MGNFFAKLWRRKILLTVIVLLLAGGGYYWYHSRQSTSAETRYVLATVAKGTLVTSVTGSGQVTVSNQVDIQPKASGTVVAVNVKEGQVVGAGALLVKLDTQDAAKTVRDAQMNLESARLSLTKLQQPADALSILQAENAVIQANETKQKADDAMGKVYEDGFNSVANTFLDLPSVMAGLQDILYGTNFGGKQWNVDYYYNSVENDNGTAFKFRNDAMTKYTTARDEYDATFNDYKAASRLSDRATIEALILKAYETTRTIAEAVKSTSNFIQFYEDKITERNLKPQSLADAHLASLNTYTGKANSRLTDLLGIQQSIKDDKNALVSADRSIAEKTASLKKLKDGPDALDIQSQQLTIKQRENALKDAQEKLANYFVTAPFAGVIAKVNVEKGDTVGSAAVVTLITQQKTAETSLNEVDVAKVKVGQNATLTFSAVPNLSIAGSVAEIDTLGTVTQGVVTYNVTIAFNTQDERVKPGMSVSAAIITDARQSALLVPNAAVKQRAGVATVEVVDPSEPRTTGSSASSGVVLSIPPQTQSVTVGLSNNTSTEVLQGLNENDRVVVRTIVPGATPSTSTSSGIRIPGIPGLGGGGPPGGR